MPGIVRLNSPRSRLKAMRTGLIAIGLTAAALSGCASNNVPVASLQSINEDLRGGYRLSSGDKLKVTVFDEKSLSGEYVIGDGGALALPLIEKIDAGGKTPEQVASAISGRLKEGGYVLNPRVSVEIMEHRPFFILGEVAKPGEYVYNSELTLDQAVAKAGGYTARADRGTIRLKRQEWPAARRVRLEGQSLKIAPGDTITVLESFF